MSKGNAATILMSGLLALSGCNQKADTAASAAASTTPATAAAPAASSAPATPAAAPTPTINASMTKVMSIQAQTIWDITSKAFNARGDGLDGSKVSAADWTALAEAGRLMKERAAELATNPHIAVAAPGETIMGADYVGRPAAIGHTWDAASVAQIQTRIAANRDLFVQRAQNLARSGEDLEKASKTKDVKTLYRVSSGLDEDCDSCHKPFWGTDEPPPFPKNKE
jgi:hypothetical protein